MFETARKYSEYAYYNKEDLEKEMDHYLVEPLWAEIEKYRSFFRFEFPLQNKKSYLIRNPHVIDQMAITQEMMQGWLCTHGEIQDAQVDTFWLKEEEQHRFSRLFVKLCYDHSLSPRQLFQEFYDHFALAKQVPREHQLLLADPTYNILLKLFLLTMTYDKRTAFLLYIAVLYLHHSLGICLLITIEELIEHTRKNISDLDVTSDFLTLLSYLRLKFSDEMISLSSDSTISPLTMDEIELCERYPMLQKESVQFYVNHRKLHHYYTLAEYMKESKVCYETARYSMEKLVALHWYQKQKIGKKFVYFIM
ncbi:MAG: hypothetical protein HFE68_04825 [Erysipelotrichaceae bacterium]|nr:hypothetical protein [Erysipelotrichaceae bacterium]MCI9312671.1 hypothetical protein [Erysipelotrichaceae bacterium]